MQGKELFNRISTIVPFLPTSLRRLIHVNMVNSIDVHTLLLLDLERTINMKNEMTSCKIVFQYGTTKQDKITFTLRFRNGSMKSLHWSL